MMAIQFNLSIIVVKNTRGSSSFCIKDHTEYGITCSSKDMLKIINQFVIILDIRG
jgi:hypothetical protein